MNNYLTREQVRQVDQLAITRYGMSALVLMENAGLNASRLIDQHFKPTGSAFIVCGMGNNGGDGCVIARHLLNAGWSVMVLMAGDPEKMSRETEANCNIVRAMGIATAMAPDQQVQLAALQTMSSDDLIIDALLGTGFSGEVREPAASLIHAMNETPKRAIVAIDIPSGLDCDSGQPSNATVQAQMTITFVAQKSGFAKPVASEFLGQVHLADIGAPHELIEEVQLSLT